MATVSHLLGRAPSRALLHLIATYFVLFAPTARRHARNYLRRALGREPRFTDHYRHVLTFASTIHDRVYLLDKCFDQFAFSIGGEELMRTMVAGGEGAFLMGAHMGSFDVTHAFGAHQPGLNIVMAMYEDNARKINAMLAALRPITKPEVISLGHIEAMLKVRQRLDEGAFVGILGDRTLGDEPLQEVHFLGSPAYFPVGPMRAAALLRRRTVFMLGLYRGGNRYHLVFELLADFSTVGRAERAAAVEQAITRYAALLEKYCRSDPYNWFNFFDFWRDGDARPSRSQ
jgi:predicted LPLAT superfamily acyltransferase